MHELVSMIRWYDDIQYIQSEGPVIVFADTIMSPPSQVQSQQWPESRSINDGFGYRTSVKLTNINCYQ